MWGWREWFPFSVVDLKFNALLSQHVNMYLSAFQTLTLCIYFPVIDLIKDLKIYITFKYSMKCHALFSFNIIAQVIVYFRVICHAF